MTELYRAMISSTTKDMVVHREQAQNACLRQDFFPVMMEHLSPSPDDAVRRFLDLVDQADVYVLVLGSRPWCSSAVIGTWPSWLASSLRTRTGCRR